MFIRDKEKFWLSYLWAGVKAFVRTCFFLIIIISFSDPIITLLVLMYNGISHGVKALPVFQTQLVLTQINNIINTLKNLNEQKEDIYDIERKNVFEETDEEIHESKVLLSKSTKSFYIYSISSFIIYIACFFSLLSYLS